MPAAVRVPQMKSAAIEIEMTSDTWAFGPVPAATAVVQ